jgi:hypothetical protein
MLLDQRTLISAGTGFPKLPATGSRNTVKSLYFPGLSGATNAYVRLMHPFSARRMLSCSPTGKGC